jgi:uncharacterized damage-inducible protein DinB
MGPECTLGDLVRWSDETTHRFLAFVSAHPGSLDVACDIAGAQTVGGVLQHIVAVELRYAERLAQVPATDYSAIPFDSADVLAETHGRAFDLLRTLLAQDALDWGEVIRFQTRTMGKLSATRRDVVLHLLFHAVRHYAQLAMVLRTNGLKLDWPMDFLFLNAKPAD